MITQHVPVIDIAPYLAGDRDAVVEQVRDACEGVGFFTITGHGVEPEIIDNLRSNARGFFARPADERKPSTTPILICRAATVPSAMRASPTDRAKKPRRI